MTLVALSVNAATAASASSADDGLVGQRAVGDEGAVHAAEGVPRRGDGGLVAGRVGGVEGDLGDVGRAAGAQVGRVGGEAGRVAGGEHERGSAAGVEARSLVRDGARRAEDQDAQRSVGHQKSAVTRRQKVDEKAGSRCAAKASHCGKKARKLSGVMQASLAG